MPLNGAPQIADTTAAPVDEDDRSCIPLPTPHEPSCCCGNVACAFLRETQAAFDRLDESLRTAGRLGQALLVRHETYVAEAEAERKLMREHVDRLSQDKTALQDQNNAVIEENRQLLEQLESANSLATDSDIHVKSLTATLHTAQEEIQRLNSLARRTKDLEREVEQFELEQSKLQTALAIKTEAERAATLRWQSSDRTLAALEDRVEAIDAEARAEREHHVEILDRLERQRALEKDLDTAAGRLKGAAAVRSGQAGVGSGVVSHFVKDILQDNANLQMSVLELKEMLSNANEEVERLREQLIDHTPTEERRDSPIDMALGGDTNNEIIKAGAQEVHVHHHYHPPSQPEPSRRNSQIIKRPKKRRQGISFGHYTPPVGRRTPSVLSVSTTGIPTPPASVLSPSNASPAGGVLANHRWSVHSGIALSSVPSSPRSYRSPSLFDRPFNDGDLDSSRPTTPGTEGGSSPYFSYSHNKRVSGTFFQPLDETLQESVEVQEDDSETPTKNSTGRDVEEGARADSPLSNREATQEEEEDPEHSLVDFNQPVPHPRSLRKRAGRPTSFTEDDLPTEMKPPSAHSLHRVASHESLLSVSGMDIHTLKSRPSQMLTGQSTRAFSSAATSITTAQAARPALNNKSSHSMLADVASDRLAGSPSGLGKRVSGWMFGRWGGGNIQPAPSPLNPAVSKLRDASGPARQQEDRVFTLAGLDDFDDDDDEFNDEGYDDDDDTTIRFEPGEGEGDGKAAEEDAELFEGADYARSGHAGAGAELERMLEGLRPGDPKRKSIEREYALLMDDAMGRSGVFSPLGV